MAYVTPKENYNGKVLSLDFGKESKTISLGGEIKYYLINKIEDGDLTLQLSLQYRFLTY